MVFRCRKNSVTALTAAILAVVFARNVAAAEVSFVLPRSAVVMAQDIGATGWPTRLASPSDEGQFEVLILKASAPLRAPHCENRYLVVRMPASVAVGPNPVVEAGAKRKKHVFDTMLDRYRRGADISFDVFTGPYGKVASDGKLELSGCNLFFKEPVATGR